MLLAAGRASSRPGLARRRDLKVGERAARRLLDRVDDLSAAGRGWCECVPGRGSTSFFRLPRPVVAPAALGEAPAYG